MYNKKLILKTAAILLAILGFATAQMKAQTIPIVQADTIFQGFGGGSVSGIVFGPTGETVIVMHDAQPVEIDIKTKQIVREFEKVQDSTNEGTGLFFQNEKNWICCNFYSFTKKIHSLIVWDYNTGKIIYSKEPSITSNGTRYYTQARDINQHKQYFCRYDINTLSIIDSVEFEQGWYHGVQQRFSAGFGIIPNSNKVLIGANVSGTRAMLYVLDFDTKIYTEIPIPFDDAQKSSTIQRIAVSETGKYFVVTMDVVNDITAYLFYDRDFKFLFKETKKTLSESWKIPNRFIDNWEPNFIHEDYVLSPARIYLKSDSIVKYCDFYNISSKSITKRIKFEHSVSIDFNNNDIIILNALGKIGLLDLDALPVENDLHSKAIQSIQFDGNSLILNTTITEKVEINISDYNGGLLYSQKEVYLNSGINAIKLNIPLPNGVYFCVIKTASESNSYKFMVNN